MKTKKYLTAIFWLIVTIAAVLLLSYEPLNAQTTYKTGIKNKTIQATNSVPINREVDNDKLKSTILSMINLIIIGNRITDISVYYYNLSNNTAFGINENEKYTPASLCKVQVMMALFKMAESDASILRQKLFIPDSLKDSYTQSAAPEGKVRVGNSYSIDSLIDYMIVFSDNIAYATLKMYLRTFGYEPLNQVYSFLNFSIDPVVSDSDNTSPKKYANTYLSLHNSWYLNNEMSQKALTILKKTTFTSGLTAGVPSGIKVAHTFGERDYVANNKWQLHDCGIIYCPENPYVLCVMSKGTDLKDQAQAISSISKVVYEAVKNDRTDSN